MREEENKIEENYILEKSKVKKTRKDIKTKRY